MGFPCSVFDLEVSFEEDPRKKQRERCFSISPDSSVFHKVTFRKDRTRKFLADSRGSRFPRVVLTIRIVGIVRDCLLLFSISVELSLTSGLWELILHATGATLRPGPR
jgi:hypothetical protein